MKQLTLLLSIFTSILLFSTACDNTGQSPTADFQSKADTVSYSLGFFYGSSLSAEGVDEINLQNFNAGLSAALEDSDPDIETSNMQLALQVFQQELEMKKSEQREQEAEGNIAEGDSFLAENSERDEVMETESGLQYRVIEEGNGVKPSAEDEVEVHYRGTLIDGTEFDSSYNRGETATFPLNRVIPGWTEGLQLMSVGSKYEFFIPSELAYGNTPPPGSPIQAGSVLIFEVELIDIK